MKPNGSFCMQCGVNTSKIREFYMLYPEIWHRATVVAERAGMLCIGCVEDRLGTRLREIDFDIRWAHLGPNPSDRLRDRRGY